MTRLTICFSDPATAKALENLCELLPGVISLEHDTYIDGNLATEPNASYTRVINSPKTKQKRKRKNGLDEALEDVAAGRVTRYDSVEDFFKEMGL